MADKTVIIKLDVQEAGAEAQIVSLNNKLSKLTAGEKDYELVLKKIAIQEDKLSRIQAKRAVVQGSVLKETKNTTKVLNKQSDATGSATAATMELSRVISDAPYGIRGMANNITQLVSQLGTASTKAGGLGSALKLMGTQLMGPLGIVFLITAAVSALDYFKGGMKKAQESVSGLTKEVYASGLVMNSYADELEDVSTSEERRAVLIQELTKAIPLLTEADLEYGKNLDEIRMKIKQYTLSQASRIEMDKLVQENSELLSKQMRVDLVNSTEDQKEKIEIIKGLLKEEGIELEKAVNQSYRMGQSNLTLRQKTNSELIQDFKYLAADIKKESDPILEQIERISQGLVLNPPKGGDEDEDIIPKQFVDSLYRELRGYEDLVSDEDFMKIEGELIIKPKVIEATDYDEIIEFIENYKGLISNLTDFIDGEFQRELTIEQNKTNALNAELNNRLNNENISKDQRQAIQNQIAQNDEKLRVKQEQIERKRFKMQKAVDISTTIMNTAVAMMKALKIYGPTPAGFIAAGLAAAQGAIQVATIARQKFQTSSSSSPRQATGSGGSGGSGRAEPSFNIVGRSNDNILLSAIQSQFDQPLRAYVVARDVTTQQQLDGVISTSAST